MSQDIIEDISKKYVPLAKKGVVLAGLAAIATSAYYEYCNSSGAQYSQETEQMLAYGPAALMTGAGMITGGIAGAVFGAIIGADITERGQSRIANAIYFACTAGPAIGFASGTAGAALGGICTVVGRMIGRTIRYIT